MIYDLGETTVTAKRDPEWPWWLWILLAFLIAGTAYNLVKK